MADELNVVHNEAAQRYEATVEGMFCVADYRRDGDEIIFTHTETPPPVSGRGIAAAIVRFALDDARAQGLRVGSTCWYVTDYIRDHPEYQDLVAS
jgi:predicted GNAT family acetyltransferase